MHFQALNHFVLNILIFQDDLSLLCYAPFVFSILFVFGMLQALSQGTCMSNTDFSEGKGGQRHSIGPCSCHYSHIHTLFWASESIRSVTNVPRITDWHSAVSPKKILARCHHPLCLNNFLTGSVLHMQQLLSPAVSYNRNGCIFIALKQTEKVLRLLTNFKVPFKQRFFVQQQVFKVLLLCS